MRIVPTAFGTAGTTEFFLVFFCVCFSLFLSFLYIFFRKITTISNSNTLLFTCALIFCCNIQNAICINIKGYLNLRNTTSCRRNII